MKHILKILSLLVAISAIWVALLRTSVVPYNYALLLPVYLIVLLGCYGLLMVGVGLMCFPTCPQEAVLLQKNLPSTYSLRKRFPINTTSWLLVDFLLELDILEAKEFLQRKGVDVATTD